MKAVTNLSIEEDINFLLMQHGGKMHVRSIADQARTIKFPFT